MVLEWIFVVSFATCFNMNCSKQTDNDGLNISGGNDEEA